MHILWNTNRYLSNKSPRFEKNIWVEIQLLYITFKTKYVHLYFIMMISTTIKQAIFEINKQQ